MIPSGREKHERPTHRELTKRLKECLSLVTARKWLPAEPDKLKANFDEMEDLLGIETTLQEDQTQILLGALGEITPEHYTGLRPPPRSYEQAILGKELFAFQWKSTCFGGLQMYFKFCVKGDGENQRVFICSVHESRDHNG